MLRAVNPVPAILTRMVALQDDPASLPLEQTLKEPIHAASPRAPPTCQAWNRRDAAVEPLHGTTARFSAR